MTDENSVTPETMAGQVEPQPAPPAAAPEIPAPTPPVEPAPVVSPEAVQEISDPIRETSSSNGAGAVTDVVTDAMDSAATPEPAPTPQPQATHQPEPPKAAPAAASTPKQSAHLHMQQVVSQRKQARLEKVVALAREKGSIANDDVQLLLNVSDSTATRYLRELAKIGRLTATGKRGRVRYTVV